MRKATKKLEQGLRLPTVNTAVQCIFIGSGVKYLNNYIVLTSKLLSLLKYKIILKIKPFYSNTEFQFPTSC